MNILFAASEVVPYAKTGGLADVAAALPKALTKLGHRVRIVMPRYKTDKIEIKGDRLPGALKIPYNFSTRLSHVYVDYSADVPVYFVDAPEHFSRPRIYGEPDDAGRFAYFSRAVLELAKASGERFDVIHLNDWMTGLVPAYLKTVYAGDAALSETKTLFTIHNISYKGTFGRELLPKLGLPESIYKTEGGIEFYGSASALKAGIVFSDGISAVSPKYAREIQTPELGEGFDGLLRARGDLIGILNGADYEEWSPETDHYIAAHYSAADLRGKQECKRDLLRTFGLPDDLRGPVIGCISRLSDQKGFDLIIEVAERMLDRGAILVLLGSGADHYERTFHALQDARPNEVGVYLGFSNELAHKVEAGADAFLMPSHFEPCGLNQMYSLRYGTIPIVRAVGGLDDTVEPFDRTTRRGNGFKFYEYNSQRLLEKIYEALLVYADPQLWHALTVNAMSADFSWNASAPRYAELYNRLMRRTAAATV